MKKLVSLGKQSKKAQRVPDRQAEARYDSAGN